MESTAHEHDTECIHGHFSTHIHTHLLTVGGRNTLLQYRVPRYFVTVRIVERNCWFRPTLAHSAFECSLAQRDHVTEQTTQCASRTQAILCRCALWRRSLIAVEKSGGQGQLGQAIKLFQITRYVTDFQTLNNPGSGQPVGASKNSFTLHF